MDVERFNEMWMPEPNSGCHLWIHGCISSGYGAMYHSGVQILAHRFSWKLHHGEIPKGLFVLHHCDTKTCVNPEHLFLGTHQDNSRDMANKGRAKTNTRKLTPEQVLEIRAKTGTLREIAKQYGVSFNTIHEIKTNVTWRRV